MTTREKVIAAAKEIEPGFNPDYAHPLFTSLVGFSAVERFYNIAFEAGAASRDAEIQRLQMALADAEALELGTAEKCDQLRAELVKALAACKAKDEALLTCQTGDYSTGHVTHPSFDEMLVESAIAIQPDDAALKAWLGEPVAWTNPKHDYFERTTPSTVFGSHTIPLYSPKELK